MKKHLWAAAALAAMLVSTVAAGAETPVDAKKAEGSVYVQCDGNPNNMSTGETVARLLSLAAVVGLLAPPPEAADASKRKFGPEGVAACSAIIDGDKAEGNVHRRVALILARAVHWIEARDYDAARADVAKARAEAAAARLTGDIYFDRSFGQSLDRIEAAIMVRQGQADEAKAKLLEKARSYPYSLFVVGAIEDFSSLSPQVTDDEIAWLRSLSRIDHSQTWVLSARLQLAGHWQEAAAVNESYLDYLAGLGDEERNTEYMTATAIVEHIAGHHDRAAELIAEARANYEDRRKRGKPENDTSRIVEQFDLFDILELTRQGQTAEARRRFSGRSEWVGITLAESLHVNALLRAGASPGELVGALSESPERIMEKRRETGLAELLARDQDKKTLFGKILPYANVAAFERMTPRVWKTDKSKLLGKEATTAKGMFYIHCGTAEWQPCNDAMLLHAALLAQQRGKAGFTFWRAREKPTYGFVRFGDPGEPMIAPTQYFAADAVIAELRQAIPSPAELQARVATRRASAK